MARGRKTQLRVELTGEARQQLECYQRSTTISAGLARRARIILLLASGAPVSHVARLVGMQRRHVYKWANRFNTFQLAGLQDRPRGGSTRSVAGPCIAPRPAPHPGPLAAG